MNHLLQLFYSEHCPMCPEAQQRVRPEELVSRLGVVKRMAQHERTNCQQLTQKLMAGAIL